MGHRAGELPLVVTVCRVFAAEATVCDATARFRETRAGVPPVPRIVRPRAPFVSSFVISRHLGSSCRGDPHDR